jgi:hypothetical protein
MSGLQIFTVIQAAMQSGLPFSTLRDMVLTHPTMAEGLGGRFPHVQ